MDWNDESLAHLDCMDLLFALQSCDPDAEWSIDDEWSHWEDTLD